jgi:aryl-alcohol dehydrogenase-like predicted oxidoreductase
VPAGSRSTLPGYEWLQPLVTNSDWIAATERLRPISQELGCTLPQLAIAWCASNPHVSTVITGASNKDQVLENMKAIDLIPRLDAAVLQQIEQAIGKIDGDLSE